MTIDTDRLTVTNPDIDTLLTTALSHHRSILVSGAMTAGKTTLLRHIASLLPTDARIGTVEHRPELCLDELPGRGSTVTTTAFGSNDDITRSLQRFTSHPVDYICLGDITGPEVLDLFAAQIATAAASLATIHATSARGAVDRLITLAMEGPDVDEAAAKRLISDHIDLIIHIDPSQGHGLVTGSATDRIVEIAWLFTHFDSTAELDLNYHYPFTFGDFTTQLDASPAPRLRDRPAPRDHVFGKTFARNLPVRTRKES
ncbi:ATPase, T2SS/T4P/T4SS family [Antrihabitans spumae]|uniref:ATPase, T2SS/T4P/T4SS family n=1 Tax=Antrihabitans spumae TaxID=3373370 RepID=A0ABW7KFE2_9NOCA